ERTHAGLEREWTDQREAREELRRDREKLEQNEERLNRRGEQQDARATRLDEIETRLDETAAELRAREQELDAAREETRQELHRVAELSREEASAIIMDRLDSELTREKAIHVRASLERAESEARRRSFDIIAQAIQRSASEVSAAISVTVVPIP